MTSFWFFHLTGRAPTGDDLDRANCQKVGEPGHAQCGKCRHGWPRFTCADRVCVEEGLKKAFPEVKL